MSEPVVIMICFDCFAAQEGGARAMAGEGCPNCGEGTLDCVVAVPAEMVMTRSGDFIKGAAQQALAAAESF